jgi:membrane protein
LQSHPEIQKSLKVFIPEIFFSAYNLLISSGIIWLGFTFIYLVMPNTRVQLFSAILGGLIGGTLWQAAQWLFQWFQSSAPYYNAIYGALYQILFLIIWMFWSWLIVLYGAEIAYTHQNLAKVRRQFSFQDDGHGLNDEYLALMAFLNISERFYAGGKPLSLKELIGVFNDQEGLAVSSLEALEKCGLIIQVSANGTHTIARYVPSRPLEQIRVKDALACLRHGHRLKLAQLIRDSNHFSFLIGQLVEQPASEWQELSVLEFLHKSNTATGRSISQ